MAVTVLLFFFLASCSAASFKTWKTVVDPTGTVDPNWKFVQRPDGKFAVTINVYGAKTTSKVALVNSKTGTVAGKWDGGPQTSSAFSSAPYLLPDSSTLFVWQNFSSMLGKATLVKLSPTFSKSAYTVVDNYHAEYGSKFWPGIPNSVVVRDVGVYLRSPFTVFNFLSRKVSEVPGININQWSFAGVGGAHAIFQNGHIYHFNSTARTHTLPVSATNFKQWKMVNNNGVPCLQFPYPNGVLAGPPYNTQVDRKGNFYSFCDAGKKNNTYSVWSWTYNGKFRWATHPFLLEQTNQPYIELTPDQSKLLYGLWIVHGTKILHVTVNVASTTTGVVKTVTTGNGIASVCNGADQSKHCTYSGTVLSDNTAVFDCHSTMGYKQYCGLSLTNGKILSGGFASPLAANTSIGSKAGVDKLGNVFACGTVEAAKTKVVCAGANTAGCLKKSRPGCFPN